MLPLILFCFGFVKLAGLALIAVAVWMLMDPTFFASMGQDPEGFYAGAYILLAVGILTFLLGMVGCCGVCKGSSSLLMTFNVFLLMIIVLEIVAAVWVYQNQESIEHYLRTTVKSSVQEKYGVSTAHTEAVDALQKQLECCGVNGPSDWAGSRYNKGDRNIIESSISSFFQVYNIPPSCCVKGQDPDVCNTARKVGIGAKILNVIYPEGCVDKVINTLKNHANILIPVCIIIIIIQCLSVITSFVRCCGLRNH